MLRHKRLQKSSSEETRTRILNAALELLRERGFERTTMRRIASTSGMASGLTVFDTVGIKRDKTAAQSLALSESAISVTPWLLLV
jgi:DNA-binding transcriptional regulator YbjK